MRAVLLILSLISGLTMAQEYPASFDAVSDKQDALGFEALNDKELAIYTIWWLEAEVNNGGFHQYFWNSTGDNAGAALKSLNKIGATKTASLLKQAMEVAFGGAAPTSRIDRQNELGVDEAAKLDRLDELDSDFYKYSEDFYRMHRCLCGGVRT